MGYDRALVWKHISRPPCTLVHPLSFPDGRVSANIRLDWNRAQLFSIDIDADLLYLEKTMRKGVFL